MNSNYSISSFHVPRAEGYLNFRHDVLDSVVEGGENSILNKTVFSQALSFPRENTLREPARQTICGKHE
jgi:hypothetical protein